MTRRQLRWVALLSAAFLLAAGLSSCSGKLGWGVVLWSSPEGHLAAGEVVPVYIKSNIEKLYVVGVPKSDKKVELPLWQVELFSSKGKAQARVRELGANVSLYMVAARDGLPLRKEAANNAKRVYRLREGETVKVLAKVPGEAVSTGGETLAGDWYQVLAEGGASGYVFSYAMRLYDETKEGPPSLAASGPQAPSGRVDAVFTRSWKPQYFQEMIDDQRIDLDLFATRYGLFTDAVRRQIRLELPGVSQVFEYSAISEEGGTFAFVDTPLRIKVAGDRRLEVSWTDSGAAQAEAADEEALPESDAAQPSASPAPAAAKPEQARPFAGRATFVTLSTEPREVIRVEELRQQKLLESFVAETGGSWKAAAGGSLSIAKSRRFSWTERGGLPEGFLPEDAGSTGDARFRLFLDPKLAGAWDGAFSLRFDPAATAGGKPKADSLQADFLYKKTEQGIILAPAALGESDAGLGRGIVAVGVDSRFEPLALDRSR